MKIVFVHGHMFNLHTWSRAHNILKEDDIHLYLFSQQQSAEKAMAFLDKETVDIFIGQLFNDLPFHDELLKSGKNARMQMGLGWDMPSDFSTFSHEQVARFNQYLSKISVENYVNGIRYIASCSGTDLYYQYPLPVQTHGIYHRAATNFFSSTAEYQTWFSKRSNRQRQGQLGSYRAKCTGEVCRILHDPELSPPHHWLAVYHYIQKTSHVVIHYGTHGALKFLPGKPVALSNECFPEISLGNLPNIYLYAMDVPGDGIVAKRRGRAVMVSHLTPVYQPAVADDDILELEKLLNQYLSARDNNAGNRKAILKEQMIPLMKVRHFLDHDDKEK